MRNMLLLLLLLVQVGTVSFPNGRVTPSRIIELTPAKMYTFRDFNAQELAYEQKYSGMWSTLHHGNLSDLKIRVKASSELGSTYAGANLFDGNPKTAWVEGASGDGIGEWVYLGLDARLESPSSTPFTVERIALIPGYAKSQTTWTENNRVKSLLVVVHTLPDCSPPENEWAVHRLLLQDDSRVQEFELPWESVGLCEYPMKKEIWLKIEDVYPGTKYHDTCISEFIVAGSCLP